MVKAVMLARVDIFERLACAFFCGVSVPEKMDRQTGHLHPHGYHAARQGPGLELCRRSAPLYRTVISREPSGYRIWASVGENFVQAIDTTNIGHMCMVSLSRRSGHLLLEGRG